jgi:hypothetical protein
LVVIDEMIAQYQLDERSLDHELQRLAAERATFIRATASSFRRVVKPLFESVVSRLADDGGGGRVEERLTDGREDLRITLWMSLDGPIIGAPRQDCHPYIQFDIDATNRRIRVWEGDMWRGEGVSRSTLPLSLDQLTEEAILDRAVAVLRRATAHTSRINGSFEKNGA